MLAPMEQWRLGRRAALTNGTVAYDVFGAGPPVVLVHGTPSWSYLWRNVVPALAPDFAVYVFDLLGYGDSLAPPATDVSVAAHARRLVELLDRLGLEEPAVAAHDIGGSIVLRAHLLDGQRFSRIALVDAVVFAPWVTDTTRHMQAHLDVYRTMPAHIYEKIVETHLRTAAFHALDDETLAAYMRPWKGEDGQAAYFRKVEQFDETETAEFEPLLATIDAPVLIVWGEQDAWLGSALAHRLHETIPRSELVLVPDAGHFAMEDAPDAVAGALSAFFTSAGA